VVLCDRSSAMQLGALDTTVVESRLVGTNNLVHDPVRLAGALADLLA